MEVLLELIICLTFKPTFFKYLLNIDLEEDDGAMDPIPPLNPPYSEVGSETTIFI